MAQALILGDEQRDLIQALKAHAEKNPIKWDRMLRMLKQEEGPIGDDPDFRIELPIGVRIVYSIETQPSGLARHISISLRGKKKPPSVSLVEVIAKEFGFKNDDTRPKKVWLDGINVVNCLELI